MSCLKKVSVFGNKWDRNCIQNFKSERLKGRDYMEDLFIDDVKINLAGTRWNGGD
jgi:hypothetical protein